MSTETQFVDGLIVKPPHEKAPEFVKAKLSIKREELIAWLQGREGEWINLDLKEGKTGKWYAAVDDWKPNNGDAQPTRAQTQPADKPLQPADFADDDIPF